MGKPWFDPETGVLMIDQYVETMPSFQKIMADGVVTDSEILEHGNKVVGLLKKLESEMTPEIKDLVTEVLCEIAVLYTLQRQHLS
jgi:hypothetical protein